LSYIYQMSTPAVACGWMAGSFLGIPSEPGTTRNGTPFHSLSSMEEGGVGPYARVLWSSVSRRGLSCFLTQRWNLEQDRRVGTAADVMKLTTLSNRSSSCSTLQNKGFNK
ncbi:hypothetical protein GOODEAATRI_017381, partial [Goodea atripinnis]